MSLRCPFAPAEGASSSYSSSPTASVNRISSSPSSASPLSSRERVIILYEQYIHLSRLQEVWMNPVTERPHLEPGFAAAMHAKRPRIEVVACNIQRQCDLLAELVDGELEEDMSSGHKVYSSLTQDFPFDGCPPTTHEPCHSPGLELLHGAVVHSLPLVTAFERISLRKVIRNITNAFESSFRDWTVAIGIESQLNQLRELVDLPRILSFDKKLRQLDYNLLVRPEAVSSTFVKQTYKHAEDFFFRSVHLGTECWAFNAIRCLESGRELAEKGEWHNAAARVRQAAHILSYLGDHVLMLTTMVLRDYLALKVEIAGTSGEGSKQVKSFRRLVKNLFDPLQESVLRLPTTTIIDLETKDRLDEDEMKACLLREALLHLYDNPEQYPGLYNYAKALESVESALLGGFYFSHYRLAVNVIGLAAKGTMNRAVKALKATYETSVFSTLDNVRSSLGDIFDNRLGHLKGRIMSDIEESYSPRTGL